MMVMNSGGPSAPQQPVSTSSCCFTLLVRHLPEGIPEDTLFRLFSHYGASSVRAPSSSKLRNCAFLDFHTQALASQAHQQLNRLRLLGKVLLVERATTNPSLLDNQQQQHSVAAAVANKDSTSSLLNRPDTDAQPIAPSLGIQYPFPPHLQYAYPPPDGNILTNIVNALIVVPCFYTQVLHLMNKMNIPAPFRMALPTPPLPTSLPAPPPLPPALVAKPHLADLSSDESELESAEEGDEDEDKSGLVDAPSKSKCGRKRCKREAIVGPAVNKDVAHEDVGLKPATLAPKEMPMIKKNNPVLQIKLAAKPIHNEDKYDADNMNESGEPGKEGMELKPFATTKDIERGKLPPEEILSLPMFKNYSAGSSATVLYIKNVAKDMITDDFYFIFGSLFRTLEAAKLGLSIS